MYNVILKKSNISILIIGTITFLLLYPVIVFDSVNKYNLVNFLIYSASFVIFLSSALSLKTQNIKSYNIFLIGFFLALFLNTINLSIKQFEKTTLDLYYYFLGPFILFVVLFFFEKIKVKKIKFKSIPKFNVNFVYLFILALYLALKIYIGQQVGFRVFEYDVLATGDKYVLPGWSGVSAILQWTLLILLPYVKKRYAVLAVFSIVVFSGILHVKRGDLVRVFLFISIYYIYLLISHKKLTLRKMVMFFCFIVVFSLVFIFFGELRLEARGAPPGVIIDYLGSRVDSPLVAWIYGYYSFSFEVLKLYYDFEPSYSFNHFVNAIFPSQDRVNIGLTTRISGWNASTFMQGHILDFGKFYFVGVFLFAFITGLIILIARTINFVGLQLFIYTLMFLLVFGDYLLHRSILFSVFFSILIFPMLKNTKKLG